MEKYLVSCVFAGIIALAGIIFFTIKIRRIINIPYTPIFTEDTLAETQSDRPNSLLELKIGYSYQGLSFSYMVGVYAVYIFYMKTFSGLAITFSFWLVSFCIRLLWANIRIKGRFTLEESQGSETGEGEVKAYRLKLIPLPLWIDVSFAVGSVMLAVLISNLLSR